MDENHSDKRLKDVDVLEFLWSDVFALLELENILRTVDDFNGSVREHLDDITCVEPSLFVECIASLFGVLVVAFSDVNALYLKLAARVRFIR